MQLSKKLMLSLFVMLVFMFVYSPSFSKEENIVSEFVTLEESNTVALNSDVTPESINALIKEVETKSSQLKKNDNIYLVLNTRGGKLYDGFRFVEFSKKLPQKIKTVSIKAYSTGFHIAQNLDERLITPNGVMMTHRSSFEVKKLYWPIDDNSEYGKTIKFITLIDEISALRMGMEFKAYRKLIMKDYYFYNKEAVKQNAADKVVNIVCAKSILETRKCPTL